jgi:hypothetical protein
VVRAAYVEPDAWFFGVPTRMPQLAQNPWLKPGFEVFALVKMR